MQLAVLLAVGSGLSSLVLTAAVRNYAVRHDVLDLPNERSSHHAPTPRGGGLAVLIGIAAALVIGGAAGAINSVDAITLGVGIVVLGLVGWMDDHGGLRARIRLVTHIAVAAWTLVMFRGFPAMRIGESSLSFGIVGWVLAIIGIVWSINLFNFMDGIDGLAGSQAVLIFAAAAWLLFVANDRSLGTIAMVISAACAGFLVHNWPPAKIFMGDVGSGAIGYLIAALAVASENHHSVPVIVYAIFGGVFIADATVTLVRRIARGDRPADAHRDHAYQRLSRAWASHERVTVAAAAVTSILCVVGAIATRSPALLLPSLLAAYSILGLLLVAAERRAPLRRA
ncbi:MAG: glycosyltransferase family 4 protein [bacterium]